MRQGCIYIVGLFHTNTPHSHIQQLTVSERCHRPAFDITVWICVMLPSDPTTIETRVCMCKWSNQATCLCPWLGWDTCQAQRSQPGGSRQPVARSPQWSPVVDGCIASSKEEPTSKEESHVGRRNSSAKSPVGVEYPRVAEFNYCRNPGGVLSPVGRRSHVQKSPPRGRSQSVEWSPCVGRSYRWASVPRWANFPFWGGDP
jgi:hypothetical protein